MGNRSSALIAGPGFVQSPAVWLGRDLFVSGTVTSGLLGNYLCMNELLTGSLTLKGFLL